MKDESFYTPSHLETLAFLLLAIQEDGAGLSWSPYREALEFYRYDHDRSEEESAAHIRAIVTRWKMEDCKLPISL